MNFNKGLILYLASIIYNFEIIIFLFYLSKVQKKNFKYFYLNKLLVGFIKKKPYKNDSMKQPTPFFKFFFVNYLFHYFVIYYHRNFIRNIINFVLGTVK